MVCARSATLYAVLVFAAVDPSSAVRTRTLVRRAVDSIHHNAVRHTHNLAKDLRVAFEGILLPRAEPGEDRKREVYCKPANQVPFSPGPGDPVTTDTITTTVVDNGTTIVTQRPATTRGGPVPTLAASPWRLTDSYEGRSFFEGWDFFTAPDPTHGAVDYIDEAAARSNGLLEVNSAGNAIMRVETTPTVPTNRKSVRITTKATFNGGLVIMDALHMPTGCGIWPAFWSNGPQWPEGGEIDIVEGVHDYTNNQATIHTSVGCTLASKSSDTLAISGSVIDGVNCAALTTGNQGCGIRAATSNSFGAGFNANRGGTYAMKWDSTGVAVYFFPRGSEPADIVAGTPLPDTWGRAQARWPAASCDPFKFFNNHHAIFDTTLCGDWAGAVWTASGIPGQEQSCAQRTGVSSCEAFIRGHGGAMADAYWEVKYVKIFQRK